MNRTMEQDDLDLLSPRAPHDDYSFQELARNYNFCQTSGRNRVFSRLIIKECENRQRPVRVLDVGCGRGIATRIDYNKAIRPYIDEYWGIEPDPSVTPDPDVFDNTQHALMETAELPENYFDLAYSSCVMEHVDDPDRFMAAIARCLKPRGTYLFVTPNARHYFTMGARVLNRLHLDEVVLRIIKSGECDYHYPVRYRFNSESAIRQCADRLGLMPPEFAYLETYGPRGYMPGPLKPFLHLGALKRRILKRPRSLITLVCRITKPDQNDECRDIDGHSSKRHVDNTY